MLKVEDFLEENKVIKSGHFLLASGRHSDKYINKDLILCSNPSLYLHIITLMAELVEDNINKKDYDIITGPAVAGISFASPLALNLGKNFVYPEKVYSMSNFGRVRNDYDMVFRNSFSNCLKGRKVILIEDIITTSKSVCKTIDGVYKCGGEVVAVFCIWNRDPDITQILSWETIIRDKAELRLSTYEVPEDHQEIPIYSLVTKKIDSYHPGVYTCPLCKQGVPLTDPKTDEILEFFGD